MAENEKIKNITRLYYSNKKLKEAFLKFSKDREIVPKYFDIFGKRPDILQYNSDIDEFVKKGATSFHASEELWENPLNLDTNLSLNDLKKLRKGWDLLIDIDSQFLDYAKVAAELIIEMFEEFGIKYGIKFSGSRGFHVIVSSKAFPEEYNGFKTKEMFPEWPKAICEYLMYKTKPKFNSIISSEEDIKRLQLRKSAKKEDIIETVCPLCGRAMQRDRVLLTRCRLCSNEKRIKKSIVSKKRILRCDLDNAPLEILSEEDIFECTTCKISNFDKDINPLKEKLEKYGKDSLAGYVKNIKESIIEREAGGADLVLVSSRHLFRMPYSLHEKTALASVILTKEELVSFEPKNANPLAIKKFGEFLPENNKDEAAGLLAESLEWKKEQEESQEKVYGQYTKIDFSGVNEKMFPKPIKKLLEGLSEGRKRGLFILLTFLKSLNFSRDYINQKIMEWNAKNKPPLKEGYVKSQIDWHLKQGRKILPPNYSNDSFYKALGLLEEKPKTKNPVVDVARQIKHLKRKT